MEDNLTQTAASLFTEFLKTNENIIKSHQGQSLLSFIFPAEKIDLYPRINGLRKKQKYYFILKNLLKVNSSLVSTQFLLLPKKVKNVSPHLKRNSKSYVKILFQTEENLRAFHFRC